MKTLAAVVGGAALVTSSVGATITATTPSTEPAITMSVPSISGPAPLFAGEAPDANPQ